jgi:hypothetical protein
MLRADKSAVLIPQRLGRTNIDFVDEHGNLMGSMDVRWSGKASTTGSSSTIALARRYSAFRCGPSGCEHFEEIPAKEEALTPGIPQARIPMGAPQ